MLTVYNNPQKTKEEEHVACICFTNLATVATVVIDITIDMLFIPAKYRYSLRCVWASDKALIVSVSKQQLYQCPVI